METRSGSWVPLIIVAVMAWIATSIMDFVLGIDLTGYGIRKYIHEFMYLCVGSSLSWAGSKRPRSRRDPLGEPPEERTREIFHG